MNHSLSSLLARHLRFHRHLLELWRHTAARYTAAPPHRRVARSAKPTAIPAPKGPRDFGFSASADRQASFAWIPWLEHRQLLLDRLQACDGPRLAADTHNLLRASGDHPLAPMLRTLQDRELSLIQSLLSLETMLRRALAGRRLALARRLLSAQRASTACKSYRRGSHA